MSHPKTRLAAARSQPRRRAADSANGDRATTADRILDVAERLVQRRGFNAVSYADIAAELGITKASLHYHFAGKTDLGLRLIARYEERFIAALAEIARAIGGAAARLRAYAEIYEGVLREDRMCLCGMLAVEFVTLSAPMRAALSHFFDTNDAWLILVLEDGRRQGKLYFKDNVRDVARMLVSSLEGAMMLARLRGEAGGFEHVARRLVADLVVPPVTQRPESHEHGDFAD